MLEGEEIKALWRQMTAGEADVLMGEIEGKAITIGDKTMRFQYFTHGKRPQGGYTLMFGLHGGGGCPAAVNDQQFQNHLHLYDQFLPEGVIWFVPRSCEDAWDMWWHAYLLDFFAVVIRGFVMRGIVNPNKVFITGYSAGGDGVYHLGPMVADWLAGAAMMAGHPNNSELHNARNISFSIQVGGQDSPYERNQLARKYIGIMQELKEQYGGFKGDYNHIHQSCSHWMNKQDAAILPNFLREVRDPYPQCILFKQHPRTKKQFFYYLQVNPQEHKDLIVLHKTGNTFHIESEPMTIVLYVNHLMVDFNQEVVIYHNNVKTVAAHPKINKQLIMQTIEQRKDPAYIFEDCFSSNPNANNQPYIPNPIPVPAPQPQPHSQPHPNSEQHHPKQILDWCCSIY